jgi:hypothetical protein
LDGEFFADLGTKGNFRQANGIAALLTVETL